MKLFKKKEIDAEPVIKSPCETFGHMWRDFPPVLHYDTNKPKPYIKVVESYVCCICHKREDVVLEKTTYGSDVSVSHIMNEVDSVKKRYKDMLQPIARVEDMIQDAIHVDRQKLQCWEKLHAPEGVQLHAPRTLME